MSTNEIRRGNFTRFIRRGLIASALGLIASIGVSIPSAQGAPPVCPAGSAGDRWFHEAGNRMSECIYVNNDHNAMPRRGEFTYYNVYCPHRLRNEDAFRIGEGIASGAVISDTSGRQVRPVRDQHQARGLQANFSGVPHVYHYSCQTQNRAGVATHIKVKVKSSDPNVVENVARSCRHFGSQNGDVVPGARMDREYKCTNQLRNDERNRGGIVHQVAARLIERDSLATARTRNAKICILPSTDIQCAPCNTSDKLVVRVQSVRRDQACPAGTVREIR